MRAAFPAGRLPVSIGSAALLSILVAASPALAQNRLTVDASASAGVSTNPFLQPGSTSSAITGTIGIRPSWVSERPLTTFRVDGSADVAFYDQGYGTNESFVVQGSGTHRLSAQTTLNASLGYINTIVGSFGDVGVPIGTPIPVNVPVSTGLPAVPGAQTPIVLPALPNVAINPALNGIGQRRQVYLASGGITTLLSPRDQIGATMALSANRSGGAQFEDFNYVTPSVSYSRTLNATTSVGATFSVGLSDYRGTSLGDATIYQPALTIAHVIGERWTLNAVVGAAITTLNGIDGSNRTSTSLNGSANICRRDTRWTACFNASRQTLPSSFEGVRTQNSVSASVGYQVSERDSLSFVGGYSHASNPIQRTAVIGPRAGSIDFANASGSYSRRLSPALSGFLTLGYAKAFDDNQAGIDANWTALVGITYRLSGQP